MAAWRPQLYERQGNAAGVDPVVLTNAIATADLLTTPALPPVFTLAHLAQQAGVDYGALRKVAGRSPNEGYRVFRIRKRPAHDGERRYRHIAVPSANLMKVQRWITQAILSKAAAHSASVAFSKGDTDRWRVKFWRGRGWRWSEIEAYQVYRAAWEPKLGHLPQGAPTSPMLANLVMRDFDAKATEIARSYGMTYTRYADDLSFSTRGAFSKAECSRLVSKIYRLMGRVGLSPNVTKTRISPPGARKIVLGLLVDGPAPRLSREFRALMRLHLHYLQKKEVGPAAHARVRGFVSVAGFRNHLQGLATYARQIDEAYGDALLRDLDKVDWPI
ncbi:MAG: hypothetical protein B7Z23_12180 [Pseudomonadales bacterium 32-61-5]|nr:MAG: hypothetical protein B7Z23_12180 [Pseudomonadales bacterium 32-61-5]